MTTYKYHINNITSTATYKILTAITRLQSYKKGTSINQPRIRSGFFVTLYSL